jgi:hypothetical protein
MADNGIHCIRVGDDGNSIGFFDASALQCVNGECISFGGAPAKVRVEAVEVLLVIVYDNHLMSVFEKTISQFRTDSSTSNDDEIHW